MAGEHTVTGTLHHRRSAHGTERLRTLIVTDIARVYVVQAFGKANLPRAENRGGRRRPSVLHTVAGEKCGNVPGCIRTEAFLYKVGDAPELPIRIVHAGNNEGCHLDPPALLLHEHEIALHSGEASGTDLRVGILPERLEIHVGSRDTRPQFIQACP